MWTHHNPYTTDKRFHHNPPTPEDRIIAAEYFKEKQLRMQTLQVTNVKQKT